jgi:beta-glucosidase/6-phospho-beta-glucosidase/beta-galactosidase
MVVSAADGPGRTRSPFDSFLLGGFECSTHRRQDGRRVDVVHSSRHDVFAEADFQLLSGCGIQTARDGLRWHLIEAQPHRFDWSSFLVVLRAARQAGVQVVWDLMHYGWPTHLDIWSPAFIDRFAAFARAAARVVRNESDAIPIYVPVNEISFFSWAGGECGFFSPYGHSRGNELKRQLVRASIAAIEAVWEVDPRARIAHVEPAIHVVPDPSRPQSVLPAKRMHEAQFTAWEMLRGSLNPELGGAPRYLDLIGLNYYSTNHWMDGGERIDWRSAQFRPLRAMLAENFRRYGRPIFIAETGIEGEHRPEWFRHVCDEVAAAVRGGVPVDGICIYPVMCHPGWDNERHCPNGLLDYDRSTYERFLHDPLVEEVFRQQVRFRELLARPGSSTQRAEGMPALQYPLRDRISASARR